ncbi:HNH endonuclease signature motif containing protein [Nocardioides sp.]|uniref:HNH endonuclease signature motif containing protein n=1 Tax=Nocardioides sp. TaxID=35761 RepID=UPI002B2745FE|nr:DUF222 domain-containing protein [Nocardioides sp.]
MSRHLDGTGTGHPILACLDVLEGELDTISDTPAWSLTAEETTTAVARLVADLARLAEVETRLLAQAEALDLPGTIGASSTSAWLARTTRMTRGEANRRTHLTQVLGAHQQTRDAMARGEVLAEQATVIGAAIDDVGDDYAAQKPLAGAHLVEQAKSFNAHDLREMGRRLFEVIDPEGADAYEARLLAAQEARARKNTQFRIAHAGDGLYKGSFTIPEAQAQMLRKALAALAAPKHVRATEGAGAYDYDKPTPQKMGHAFCEYIERYPAAQLPKMGGLAATIIITAEADVLTHGAAKASTTDTGTKVSPGQLLRFACDAKIIPAVLDKGAHVLDLGRGRRLHSPAQRLALIVEQKTCQHPACDVTGAYCHVHHTNPWKPGGETNTRDALLLCPFHHHQSHATGQTYPLRT